MGFTKEKKKPIQLICAAEYSPTDAVEAMKCHILRLQKLS